MSRGVRSLISCIGLGSPGTVSVLGDLFGFVRQRVPTDPEPTVTAEVHLLDHMKRLQGPHLHVNIIRVGIDNFSADEVERIDYALYKCRNIYAPQGLTLGRALHFDITATDANGRDDISSKDEAEDLTQEWSVDNDALDVFMVDNISAKFVGLSPVEGPCDKDAKGMNGCLGGEVNRGYDAVARTFAHEIGHYLGLEHRSDPDNLMTQTGSAASVRDSVELTDAQGRDMRDHCFMNPGC